VVLNLAHLPREFLKLKTQAEGQMNGNSISMKKIFKEGGEPLIW
jgi:hypothetical protein